MRHGFLLIHKPAGPTSHDVVQQVRKKLGESKVGHLGTLDPAATGLLVIAIGAKALKVIEYFNDLTKEYVAGVKFGAVSTTYDREGIIEAVETKPGWIEPDEIAVRRVIEDRFLGSIEQVPPIYSAVHVNGQRAHEAARLGKKIELQKRGVQVSACDIMRYAYPDLTIRVACSSGTYIRSLAHDLGTALRCGAYLSSLERTKVGEWDLKNSVSHDAAAWTDVIPLKDILKDFHGIELTDKEAEDIRFGRFIDKEVKPGTIGWHGGLPVVVLTPAKDGSRRAQPKKVL